MNSTEMKTKVLKMYVGKYKSLNLLDHQQLMHILKSIYHELNFHPEKNYIFFGNVRPKVATILVTNGFNPTTLTIAGMALRVPVITW